MYAVVEIKGKQFKASSGAELVIPKTNAAEGDQITYDRVLYVHNGNAPQIGTPTVEGATVEATVLGHGKSDKITVFKKKRRARYKRKRGHRQPYTKIRIDDIGTGAGTSNPSKPAETDQSEETSEEKTSEE